MLADRYVVISSDGHAGLPPERYRDYLEKRYHDAFDAALPVQIEMTKAAEKRFLIADINAEWRRGRQRALPGAWESGAGPGGIDGGGGAGRSPFPGGRPERHAPPGGARAARRSQADRARRRR